jgi:hypothetical protein
VKHLVVGALLAVSVASGAPADAAEKLLPSTVAALVERADSHEAAGRFADALAIYTRLGRSRDVPNEPRARYRSHANVLAILLGQTPPFDTRDAPETRAPKTPIDKGTLVLATVGVIGGAALGGGLAFLIASGPGPNAGPSNWSGHTALFDVTARGEQSPVAGRRTRGAGAMITAARF